MVKGLLAIFVTANVTQPARELAEGHHPHVGTRALARVDPLTDMATRNEAPPNKAAANARCAEEAG